MIAQRKNSINRIGFTEKNALTHLLNTDDTNDDNEPH